MSSDPSDMNQLREEFDNAYIIDRQEYILEMMENEDDTFSLTIIARRWMSIYNPRKVLSRTICCPRNLALALGYWVLHSTHGGFMEAYVIKVIEADPEAKIPSNEALAKVVRELIAAKL